MCPKPDPDVKTRSTRCLQCRDILKRYGASNKNKANQKRYDATDKGKASTSRKNTGEKCKARKKRYNASDKGKACIRGNDRKMMNRLSHSLIKMLNGTHDRPSTFRGLGLFEDNVDVETHIKSTFLPWMNDCPFGPRINTTLPKTVLQIGHRIPKVWYRHDDKEEIKKCWSRTNLFAQCSVENHNARDRNILSAAQWLDLKPIWPKQCAAMTDKEAWEWARDNVDNTTRRLERAAEKATPSCEAGPSYLNVAYSTDEEEEDESGDDSDSESD